MIKHGISTRQKLVIGLGLLTVFVLLQISLHFLRTDLNPAWRFVSEYGVGDFSLLFFLSLFPLGASTIWLGFKFNARSKDLRDLIGGALLVASGLATFTVAFFPTDLLGDPLTEHGFIHGIAATISFATTTLAYLILMSRIKRREFVILALINLGLLIYFSLFAASELKGLFERALLASIVVNSVYLHLFTEDIIPTK